MSDATTDRHAVRTHHHTEFDGRVLARRKHELGLTAAVVIPARNEAPTVGQVAGTLARHLRDDIGLVDDVLVVDADSTDGTGEVARAAGARVVRQSEVLADLGTALGKGEAMWKGLAATTADLLVYVDADIRDIGPRFVVGLLGPLLTDPTVDFVKATYDRPLHLEDAARPSGGGRVTELLARPLIATFWPQLGGLAQPLAGEIAARRSLLETLPFVRGYGIELAMLVDLLERYGAGAITQVDLGRRVHDHQSIDALGRMATEILQVAVDRLTRQGRMTLADSVGTQLLQPSRQADGSLALIAHDITHAERPPLSDVTGSTR